MNLSMNLDARHRIEVFPAMLSRDEIALLRVVVQARPTRTKYNLRFHHGQEDLLVGIVRC